MLQTVWHLFRSDLIFTILLSMEFTFFNAYLPSITNTILFCPMAGVPH